MIKRTLELNRKGEIVIKKEETKENGKKSYSCLNFTAILRMHNRNNKKKFELLEEQIFNLSQELREIKEILINHNLKGEIKKMEGELS